MQDQFGLLQPPSDSGQGQPLMTQVVQPLKSLTQPFPTVIVDSVTYKSEYGTLSLHRTDGKRLTFRNGFYTTTVRADQEYLDAEINQGTPGLRRATIEEAEQAAFMENPLKATADRTERSVKQKMESEFESRLQQERAAMQAEFENRLRTMTNMAGQNLGTGGADKVGNVSGSTAEVEKSQATGLFKGSVVDANKPVVKLGLPQNAAAMLGVANSSNIAGAAPNSNSK